MQILDSVIEGALAMPSRRDADALVCAVVRFMATGEEPELSGVANAMWIAIKPAVENSRSKVVNGRSGGNQKAANRKSKTGSKAPSKRVSKRGSETGSETGSKTGSETGSKDTEKECSETPSDIYSSSSSYSYSHSSSPSDSTYGDPSAPDGEPSAPDSAGDVAAYFAANCLKGDPAEFFDHFEAQGWVRSNGQPIADWRAQARQWSRRQPEFDQSKPADMRQPVEKLPVAQNAIDWEAELAKLEGGA